MTIVELSKRSGQSTGFLSQIERGISIPSVSAIESIAAALGVRVTWFFEAGEVSASSEGDVVVRKGNRRRLTYATGIDDQLLSPQLNGPLEMFLATFAPGSGNGEEWLKTSGYQAGMVLEGQLSLTVDSNEYDLKAGDSFGFDGTRRHKYVNPGRSNALVIWAFTRPNT
jgi:transcriptional regulator with XRE-family HTH domain